MRMSPWVGAGLALLGACGSADEQVRQAPDRAAAVGDPSAVEPVLRSELLVSAEWLEGRLEDPDVVVLHVDRNRDLYDDGHIPGARFLPLSTIVTDLDGVANELPPVAQLDSVLASLGVSENSRVVVYGPPLAAARAFFTLDYLGRGDRAALLNGGLGEWRSTGRPLSTELPQVQPGSLASRPQEGREVDAEWVNDHLDDPAVALLDARPLDQFTGTEAGAGVPRPGHIPGAGQLFWEELIRSSETPLLKDVETLRAMFRNAGVEAGDTVVTYCRTGMQASFAYFVARYLGYEARMYDASFMDWSRREDLPVER